MSSRAETTNFGVTVRDCRNGFVAKTLTSWSDADEPSLATVTAFTLSVGSPLEGGKSCLRIHGSGVSEDPRHARLLAISEAMERYGAALYKDEQCTWSSSEELYGKVLDLSTIPRCSDLEIARPQCSLSLPSKLARIRWVEGLSLHDGLTTFVPAVMVFSHAGWRVPEERFWLPISTGCASHVSYEQALVKAICEVIERDAIALVWLLQLRLPKILIEGPISSRTEWWDSMQKASADTEFHFFNATGDIGLPTVYGLRVSPNHPFARTTVACSTALTFDEAIGKTFRDLIAGKRAFTVDRRLPKDPMEFKGLLDGAAYMALPENAHVFEFLLKTPDVVRLTELADFDARQNELPRILGRLRALGMQVIAVDLTPDEGIRLDLRVVRVIIPELQPLSLHRAAQYRGHARIYTYPVQTGRKMRTEEELNTWPQPFA